MLNSMATLSIHREQLEEDWDRTDRAQREMQDKCERDGLRVHLAAVSYQDSQEGRTMQQHSSAARQQDYRQGRQEQGNSRSYYDDGHKVVEVPPRHVSFGGNSKQQVMSPEQKAKLKSMPCTPNLSYSCPKTEALCWYSHDERLRQQTLRQMNEAKPPGVGQVHAAPQPLPAPPEQRTQARASVSAVQVLRRDSSQTHGAGVGAGRADSDFEEER